MFILKTPENTLYCTFEKTDVLYLAIAVTVNTTKVGDTLTAGVVDRNGEDVSDNVTFQWYANDEAIEGADEETLVVDSDLLGAALKVVVTAENGNTFESDETEPVEEADGQIEITSATATKVNEIEVTLAHAVDSTDTVATLTKGSDTFAVTAKWADTADSVTLTTAAKMTEGTYKVTLTSKEDATNTDSAEFTVEGQKVAEIVILNDVALTSADKFTAFAYYDVLDQYGESMRASTSIQWSGSAKVKVNKTDGQLELTKNDGTAWVYNDKIYLTGVYTKTGVAMSKELAVGTEQSLDTIEMKGFVKKGTSDIVKKLPADFKDKEYYMIFNAIDQNGNNIAADDVDTSTVTFVSDNVLVVKELTSFATTPLTIKGDAYNAVFVTPGIKVADGGEVTVTAIANKTGNKTEMNFVVGEDPVVMSFKLSAPTTTVADGDEDVVIPFEALDENGNAIKNFLTLAKQETFNTLSFNASEGSLKLAEQDDGTAKLTWTDDPKFVANTNAAWSLSQTTDGIDRPVSLTVVVVGGEADNEMISVSDKRRPDAISAVKLDDVYVEGAAPTVTLTDSFKFFDQYGTIIGDDWGDDNGFFTAGFDGTVLKGVDFANYKFGVRMQNAGAGKITYNGGASYAYNYGTTGKLIIRKGATAKFATATDIKSAATGEGFKFEIAKVKPDSVRDVYEYDPEDWESVSPSKFQPLTVVDITQVKNLVVGDLNTFYVGKLNVTGDKIIEQTAALPALKDTPLTVTSAAAGTEKGIYDADGDYRQEVKVTGTYNGSKVTIPNSYYTVSANKMKDTDSDDKFDEIIPYAPTVTSGLQAADLYDKTTAKGTAKLADDEVTATVYKLYSDENSGEAYFWAYDNVSGEFEKKEIPAGARSSTIATLLSESNATLTSTANITQAQTAASNAAKLAAVNEVLEGEGYTALTDNNGAYTDLTAFIAGTAPYNTRTADKGTTTSKSDAATKLAAATATLTTKAAAEEDAAAALGTANTTTANGFVTDLDTALTNEVAGTLTDTQVTAAAAVVDGADNSVTATEILGAVNNNHMQITGDDLRTAAITYITKKRDQLVTKAAFEATAMYSEAANKAKADLLLTDAELKAMTDPEITAAATTAINAGTATETTAGDLADYLIAKKNNLKAIDTVNEKKDALNALKTGASTTADSAAFTVTAATTNPQIEALPYRSNGLAPKEEAAVTYLKAVRDRFKAQETVTNTEKAYKAWVEEEAVTAAGAAWTTSDDQAVADAFAALVDLNNANTSGIPEAAVYDTAKAAITLSDQAPYAAKITGVKESYTLNPTNTAAGLYADDDTLEDVVLVDQYGVEIAGEILLTVSNVEESKEGYASNNFAVTGNGEAIVAIEGAERLDTFKLTLSHGTIKETTTITIGADTLACIVDSDNYYNDVLKKTLETQRIAGLG